MGLATEGDLRRFRKASEADARHGRAIATTMHERNCSPQEANSIRIDRERKERQAKVQAFANELEETAKTLEQTAAALPRHKREQFWDLPLRRALSMAVRHFAPRVRGRCDRRPRPVRRRSGHTTRAGPSELDPPSRPPLPEGVAAAKAFPEAARAPVGARALRCSNDPGLWSGRRKERR
jgi:hypothetical protein